MLCVSVCWQNMASAYSGHCYVHSWIIPRSNCVLCMEGLHWLFVSRHSRIWIVAHIMLLMCSKLWPTQLVNAYIRKLLVCFYIFGFCKAMLSDLICLLCILKRRFYLFACNDVVCIEWSWLTNDNKNMYTGVKLLPIEVNLMCMFVICDCD